MRAMILARVAGLDENDEPLELAEMSRPEPADEEILVGQPHIKDVHTVSIYMGSSRQEDYYDYIFSLEPKRVIFNPGTVNPELMGKLKHAGIEPVSECMLVMLSDNEF